MPFIDNPRAAVFELKNSGSSSGKDSNPEILGTFSGKSMFAHATDPGRHLFMVTGQEGADFMEADLLPNKIYYALVLGRPGKFFPLYSFKSVDKQAQGSNDFKEMIASSRWVDQSTAAGYAASNMPHIKSRQHEGYDLWAQKADAEKARLRPEDGADPR